MLKNLMVHGFKSIERQTIALGALNVLIGANGSGKSNLLGALHPRRMNYPTQPNPPTLYPYFRAR